MGVDGSTGEGEDEMDSVLRDSVRYSGPSRTPSRKIKRFLKMPIENSANLSFLNFSLMFEGQFFCRFSRRAGHSYPGSPSSSCPYVLR